MRRVLLIAAAAATRAHDELQPTESFRNVSDPQYEFGTLGGDDMGKAFA